MIFPLHPRTRKSLEAWGLEVPANVEVRDAVTYTEMLALERDAVAIATDSGGVQREAYLWGVPCITMREETEWIETVSTGWNTLVGVDAEKFSAALAKPQPQRAPADLRRRQRRRADRRTDRGSSRADRGGIRLSEQLRIGVIGCGRMGGFHVRNYSQIDCAHLVAVAEPERGVAPAGHSASTGVAEYSDWRELIEFGADELDAVSIACPSEYHAEVALEALAAGLHVLVEKPIATTLPDALRMRGAAMEADRKLMVGHVERFNPAVAKLRELVADGPPRQRSTAPTRRGSGRCRRGSRTPASRSTSPPTTLT